MADIDHELEAAFANGTPLDDHDPELDAAFDAGTPVLEGSYDLRPGAKHWKPSDAAPPAARTEAAPATQDPGIMQTLAHKFLQGTAKRGSDELIGAAAQAGNKSTVSSGNDVYRTGRDNERRVLAAIDEHHPVLGGIAEAAGDVGTDVLAHIAGVPVANQVYQTASGALSGFLGSDAELTSDKVTPSSAGQALADTAFGGAVGYVGGKYVAPVVGGAVDAVGGAVGGVLKKGAQETKEALVGPLRKAAAAGLEEAGQKAEGTAAQEVLSQNAAEIAAANKAIAAQQELRAKAHDTLLKDLQKRQAALAAQAAGAGPTPAEVKAKDVLFKRLQAKNAREVTAGDRALASAKEKVYAAYAKAANDGGMNAEQAANWLKLNENDPTLSKLIEEQYKRELAKTYNPQVRALTKTVRDAKHGLVAPKTDAQAATLAQGAQHLDEIGQEILDRGMPQLPKKLTEEEMKARLVETVRKSHKKGLKAAEQKFGEATSIPPDVQERLARKFLESKNVKLAKPLTPAELEAAAAELLNSPEGLKQLGPRLEREVLAARAKPPTAPAAKAMTQQELEAEAQRLLETPWPLRERDPKLARQVFSPRVDPAAPPTLAEDAARAVAKSKINDPEWLARHPELGARLAAARAAAAAPDDELAKQLSGKAHGGELMQDALKIGAKVPGLGIPAKMLQHATESPASKYAAANRSIARINRVQELLGTGARITAPAAAEALTRQEKLTPEQLKERRALILKALNARAGKAK